MTDAKRQAVINALDNMPDESILYTMNVTAEELADVKAYKAELESKEIKEGDIINE